MHKADCFVEDLYHEELTRSRSYTALGERRTGVARTSGAAFFFAQATLWVTVEAALCVVSPDFTLVTPLSHGTLRTVFALVAPSSLFCSILTVFQPRSEFLANELAYTTLCMTPSLRHLLYDTVTSSPFVWHRHFITFCTRDLWVQSDALSEVL